MQCCFLCICFAFWMCAWEQQTVHSAALPRHKLNPKTQSTQYVLFVQQFAFVSTDFLLHFNGTIRFRFFSVCDLNSHFVYGSLCNGTIALRTADDFIPTNISLFFCQQQPNHLIIWCLDPRPMQIIDGTRIQYLHDGHYVFLAEERLMRVPFAFNLLVFAMCLCFGSKNCQTRTKCPCLIKMYICAKRKKPLNIPRQKVPLTTILA